MKPAERPVTADREDLTEELLAAINARKELAASDERYLVEAFVDRLERDIDARIEARMRDQRPHRRGVGPGTIVLVLLFAIPVTAIAGHFAGLLGIAVVWIALAAMVDRAGR